MEIDRRRGRQLDHEIGAGLIARLAIAVDDEERVAGKVARIGRDEQGVARLEYGAAEQGGEIGVEAAL